MAGCGLPRRSRRARSRSPRGECRASGSRDRARPRASSRSSLPKPRWVGRTFAGSYPWDDVERAEGDSPQVWGEVVDVAALEAFLVLHECDSFQSIEMLVACMELGALLAGRGVDQGVRHMQAMIKAVVCGL